MNGLAISCGKADITPDLGGLLGGYPQSAPRVASEIGRPLTARCTILWDENCPNVLVTTDTLVVTPSMNRDIRQRLTRLGVAESDFILTVTHTHTGGAVAGGYTYRLVTRVVALVQETLARVPTPCALDYQVLDESFARNRGSLPHAERDAPTLVARAHDGRPLAVLFGYGCRPVTLGDLPMFDPDYPGTAIDWIEGRTGAFAQFILGPAGDQDPDGDRGPGPAAKIGESLGRTVIDGLATLGRPVTGPIATVYTSVTLPLDVADTPPDQRAASSISLPLQRWTFQGSPALRLVFTGGELVSGYAVYFRQRYGGSEAVWITGYANEIPAYIPSDELLHAGAGVVESGGYPRRLKGRTPGTSEIGVEQILTAGLTALL